MKRHIIPFSKEQNVITDDKLELVGERGKRIFELAQLELPISPGFILDSYLLSRITEVDIVELISPFIKAIEDKTQKGFGDPQKPLLLKAVVSPNLVLPYYPSVHNIGLNWDTVKGLAKLTGEEFAYKEMFNLFDKVGQKIILADDEEFLSFREKIQKNAGKLKKTGSSRAKTWRPQIEEAINEYAKYYGDKFSMDPMEQLVSIIESIAKSYGGKEKEGEEVAILIQAMVFGNFGESSYAGIYYTRNKINGEAKLDGNFVQNSFDDRAGKRPKDINQLEGSYLDVLYAIANKVEEYFIELRQIKFTIEEGNLWLVDQYNVQDKSTQADIRTLLDLYHNKKIDETYVIKQIPPGQLSDLLHAIINPASVKGMVSVEGGLAGSPGAAVGRVYFSTAKLMESYKEFLLKGEDTKVILAVEASYAEDVKAIEVAQGVISIEGGYSSHAPVVARSLGKVAVVNPEIKMKANSFTLNGKTIKEGDYITLDVPFYRDPVMYFGKADLINPDPEQNGLIDYLAVVEKKIDNFNVRVNADSAKEVTLARKFGAVGVGLCRTEHMFFEENRINIFREMIVADDEESRIKALDRLLPIQKNDFYKIFKAMDGLPVTIRLLDAPLHEFLPRDKDSFANFFNYLKTQKKGINQGDLSNAIDRLHEFNPMLGHRGCRVGITYPEIYEMQVRAIFEAAYMVKKEGLEVIPEIMVPIVMNKNELKFVRNGKKIEGKAVKGIRDIYREVVESHGIEDFDYKVGTMIELPAAALDSGEIAQYAQFFSYGTNDLTQTTYGISRDDMNNFYGSYTEFDILPNNPFKVLGDQVKELISISANRGLMTRPDIKLGLCGEHGADPENIKFLYEAGLNYVSTSTYSVPIAKLAVAQLMIEKEAHEAK